MNSIGGQYIKSGEYKSEIDLVELRSGIYILTIKQDNKVINRKIIKE
ncbi:MAG: T9SS type A sorting domain-containing protein [Flavobacteriales bacterium]